jgi:glycosyltransferase involved in cell wall biosynthesis
MIKTNVPKRYAVAQLGARMHYAVPRALASADLLERFFTDGVSPKWLAYLIQIIPRFLDVGILRRAAGRLSPKVLDGKIRAFPIFGLYYFLRRYMSRQPEDRIYSFLWAGKRFSTLVRKCGFGKANAVYGFNSASLEIFQEANQQGLKCVLEQTIVPKSYEMRLLEAEQKKWPIWEKHLNHTSPLQEFIQREKKEWQLADTIVCGSAFVKDALQQEGAPAKKCAVIPYGYAWEGKHKATTTGMPSCEKLKLLTVGTVNLRKGAPWLLALATALKDSVHFRWVGSLQISKEAQLEMLGHVELTGAVPRLDMNIHYEWADALILLSVCEGSATVIYEALARGIPVICTTNSGPPLKNSKWQQILPPCDTKAALKSVQCFKRWKIDGCLPSVPEKEKLFVSYDAYVSRLTHVLSQS